MRLQCFCALYLKSNILVHPKKKHFFAAAEPQGLSLKVTAVAFSSQVRLKYVFGTAVNAVKHR